MMDNSTNSSVPFNRVQTQFNEFAFKHKLSTEIELKLDDADIIPLLQLALKYIPDRVPELCNEVITVRNMFQIFEECGRLNLPDIQTAVMSKFGENVDRIEDLLHSEKFMSSVDKDTLADLLKSDDLECSEIIIFEIVMRWIKAQPGSSVTQSFRQKFPEILELIRFPLMTRKQLKNVIFKENILSETEKTELIINASAEEDEESDDLPVCAPFCKRPRRHLDQIMATSLETTKTGGGSTISPSANNSRQILSSIANESNADNSTQRTHTPSPEIDDSTRYYIEDDKDIDLGTARSSRDVKPPKGITQAPSQPKIKKKVIELSFSDSTTDSSEGEANDGGENIQIFVETSTWSNLHNTIKKSPNARSISLKLTLNGKVTPQNRIMMKHLEEVCLDIKLLRHKKAKENPVVSLRRNGFSLDDYVFFEKRAGAPTIVNTLTNTKYELIMNGFTFFKVDPSKKEAVLGFRDETFKTLAKLRTIVPKLESLLIVDNCIPTATFNYLPYTTITYLMLWGIDYHAKNLNLFLRKFTNLETLILWMRGAGDKVCIDLCKDLTSGNKLKKVAICFAKFVSTGIIDKVKFANLKHLYTDYAHWSEEVLLNFGKIFPKLERVSLGYDQEEHEDKVGVKSAKFMKIAKPSKLLISAIPCSLLDKLTKMESVKWIRVNKLDWAGDEQKLGGVEKFFRDAGSRKGRPKDFLVEYDNNCQAWKMGEIENCHGMGDILEYDCFELDKVFRDFDTFLDCNVPIL